MPIQMNVLIHVRCLCLFWYESKEKALYDLELKYEEYIDSLKRKVYKDSTFNFCGYDLDLNYLGFPSMPSMIYIFDTNCVVTLDEWFEQNKIN